MPKSRVRKKPRARSRRPEVSMVLGREDLLVLAQSTRSSCDQCGSGHLHWGDLAGGVFDARLDAQRAAFTEAVGAGMSTECAAWWCMECANLGIFVG